MDPSTVQQDNFPLILQRTLAYEGGDKLDPTGPSKFGVLEKNYWSYLKRNGQEPRPIKQITLPEATDIYRKDYYQANSLHNLPLRASAVVFDWTVHSGAGNSIKALQKIVGAEPDGKFGPKTLEAVNRFIGEYGEDALVESVMEARRAFMERFLKRNPKAPAEGLRNRLDKVETDWLRTNHGIRSLKRK